MIELQNVTVTLNHLDKSILINDFGGPDCVKVLHREEYEAEFPTEYSNNPALYRVSVNNVIYLAVDYVATFQTKHNQMFSPIDYEQRLRERKDKRILLSQEELVKLLNAVPDSMQCVPYFHPTFMQCKHCMKASKAMDALTQGFTHADDCVMLIVEKLRVEFDD